MSTAIPMLIYLLSAPRIDFHANILLGIALFCALATVLSRLYMSVHYPLDVVVGLVLGWVTLFCCLAWHEDLDDYFLQSPWTLLVIPFVAAVLVW